MKKFYNLELVEDDYNYPISYNRISINHDGTAEIKVFKNGILRHREKPTHLIEAPDDNENLERSMRRTKKMIREYAYNNPFEYFVTFTFARDQDGLYYDNGDAYDIRRPKDVKRLLTRFYKKVNNYCRRIGIPRMMYLFVLERHKSGHLHVHGLLYGIPERYMVDAKRKDKNGSKIYNVKGWGHGFSTAIKVYRDDPDSNAKMSRYITKYITADLENLYEKGEQRYYVSQGLKKPIVRYDLIKD